MTTLVSKLLEQYNIWLNNLSTRTTYIHMQRDLQTELINILYFNLTTLRLREEFLRILYYYCHDVTSKQTHI